MASWREAHAAPARWTTARSVQRWEAPEDGWIKANVDGALEKQQNKGGGGTILRDHNGGYVASACFFFPQCADPERAELMACLKAIKMARELNVDRIHVELDCQALAKMIMSPEKNFSLVGPWVEEVKKSLGEFMDFKVGWVRRSANSIAHKLTRVGVGEERCQVWTGVPPGFILDVVSDDILV
ncbi:uncharacterized protein [Aegilops tauschii subsp. strangulata]|uniref:uncharacterized protein n=1 Tax=Aegilops tauschii subsp. strangulata TaxID=200361 RepID=UPI003CC84593